MAKICELKINNFRGIKTFSHKFDKDFVCLLGRGDSGKTTILDAISLALSQNWNTPVYDSDFYNGAVDNTISIEVSLRDLPIELIKEDIGLYVRGIDSLGNIYDELKDEYAKVLTIRFEVKKDLEPQWHFVNNRQEPLWISANTRANLNMFMVSDYIDRHFSWNKGNPLYSILRENESGDKEKSNTVLNALRELKVKIDQDEFVQFKDITERVKRNASNFGVNLSGAKTTIDFKDVFIKDSKACLHDGGIPLRLKGKGTKRLISVAIQSILTQFGGIILIDEVEQGLEPDRIKHLIRTLAKDEKGQVFITTHSSEVITELEAENLLRVSNDAGNVSVSALNENFQDIIRACPEAGYAEKVIVCEGATEIGLCRSLDEYRQSKTKKSMSNMGCVYVDGKGHSFSERAKKLSELGIIACVFCDSDKDAELIPNKEVLKSSKIKVFDCESNNDIESQVFKDLPWEGVLELIDYVSKCKQQGEKPLKDAIKVKYSGKFPEDFRSNNTPAMREAIAKASVTKGKEWFKRTDRGEFLGLTIFKYIDKMDSTMLKKQLFELSAWIDA